MPEQQNQVVGIQLQLIAVEQAATLVDIRIERRDLALAGDPPMEVARRGSRCAGPWGYVSLGSTFCGIIMHNAVASL